MASLTEELFSAARGFVALLIGRRDAPSYFDLTARGLAGSFIVFALSAGIQAVLLKDWVQVGATGDPELAPLADLTTFHMLILVLVLSGLQFGFAALFLQIMRRLDGFLPYLVAGNWTSFFLIAASILLGLLAPTSGLVQMALFGALLAVQVNIARLLATLKPGQVIGFLIMQYVGPIFIFAFLLAAVLPA